jgi:transcriptional regulator with XRE-family HTH domain
LNNIISILGLMADSFGKILRRRRLDSDVGLRELARLIGKSPGYISDVEQGNVPPPSEQVILKMAAVLDINREILLKAARKMDPELTSYVADEPRAADFLRKAKDRGFEPEDWEKLSKLADIVKPDTSAGGDE